MMLLAPLLGFLAGKAMTPSAPKMPKPIAPPAAPIKASETAAGERARRAGVAPRGVSSLVLSPLGGSAANAGVQRKSLLGG